MKPRVIALGHRFAGDDGAALEVAERLRARGHDVVSAGRPGAGLLELLDAPTVLLDVVRRGASPGVVIELPLETLADASVAERSVSSHDLGPSAALRLGAALGRPTPRGTFVGLGGERFDPSDELSPKVRAGLDAMERAALAALARLST
ncbi:MAG: hydrogenase maturation protease [Sandaracinus sp.]|nr:hydrogenase maturation protease [Myxococcales bacterium]MCB9611008.1 hydrogenase maturation protease [Sandaracinus sp.]MCB9630996.1 hydrogenase maturation protease [Sandaracinus sp.]